MAAHQDTQRLIRHFLVLYPESAHRNVIRHGNLFVHRIQTVVQRFQNFIRRSLGILNEWSRLAYWWTVDIILRPLESKGASPTTRRGSSSRFILIQAQLVGVIDKSTFGRLTDSILRRTDPARRHCRSAIAVARSFSSSPRYSTTVILFCVKVPVLSEQIIWVHPRVSTAVSLRIIGVSFGLIFVTPIDKHDRDDCRQTFRNGGNCQAHGHHEGVQSYGFTCHMRILHGSRLDCEDDHDR